MLSRLGWDQTSQIYPFIDLSLILSVVAFSVNLKNIDTEVLDVLDF